MSLRSPSRAIPSRAPSNPSPSKPSTSPIRLQLLVVLFAIFAALTALPAIAQDACDPNPCQNGGRCQGEGSEFFGCRCPAGFDGEFCEIDLSDSSCEPNPCLNGGTCTDTGGGTFTCACPPGTSGTTCETVADVCSPNPCLNGGTCTSEEPGIFECRCDIGFTGDLCEIVDDPCDPNPCQNEGICRNEEGGGFSCDCIGGTSGTLCEIGADPCDPSPCLNGGICDSVGSIFLGCRCRFGFDGEFCETVLDICDPNPCANGGTCINNLDGTTSCDCAEGFSGELCETPDGPCNPDPCLNDGTCITDGTTFFGCSCIPPFTGQFCGESTDPCNPDPCLNDGICQDDGIDFLGCLCQPGFDGTTCETDNGLSYIGSDFDGDEAGISDFRQGLVGILDGGAAFTNIAQEGRQALALDGTGYLEVDDAGAGSAVDFPNSFTLSLWARPDNLGGNQMLISKDDSFELEIGKIADSTWNLRINNIVIGESTVPVQEEVWQHLAVTWDGTDVLYYYNGEPAGESTFSGTAADNDNDLGVGGRPSEPQNGGPVFLFDGGIDEVRIYSSALTAEQVSNLVAVTLGDNTAPVLTNLLPVSPVTAGTALTLGVTSDDDTTSCRAWLAPGERFDDMFLNMAAIGANHTLSIGSVADGSITRWYVRCRDAAGNTNNEDVEVAFVAGSVDLVTNLVGFWPLDDGAGCVATDASGFNDGNLGPDCLGGNGPIWEPAVNGTGLTFDGGDDVVSVPADPALETPTALTIAAWVKQDTSHIFRSIIDRRDAGDVGYDLFITDQSKLFLRVDDGVLTGNAVVADGSWHHVAGTYDGNELRLYVDGVLDASVVVGPKTIEVAADLLMGRQFAGSSFSLQGSLDEVMLYGRALSAIEVFQTYLSTQP